MQKLDEIVQSLFKGEDNGKNIGLRNVYRRLNLFYAERSLFHIESIPFEKTSVTIQIPLSLIKNKEEAIWTCIKLFLLMISRLLWKE